ncbi:phage tail assembly protein T [Moraxella canis]|uniref:Minor tail T domain-containing protein n=1 Tax=Moraxella canis TaxID=90239 RepID=A0A1S9ZKK4_9GAMM|nr:DUF4035 domain-containing protein [Moraxella canis]OOR83976.1 hypothetical protein B0180_05595 [Moraxella canis]
MSFSEFMEWQAFDIIDPIGGFRQDIQTAYWMSRLYGDKNHSMVDFMPIDPNPMTEEQLAELKNAQTIAEARAEVMELIAMLNNRA